MQNYYVKEKMKPEKCKYRISDFKSRKNKEINKNKERK